MKKALKEGEYVRVLGRVTIYKPHKKVQGVWVGGSSWSVKNPLVRIGKCKHKPIKKERGKSLIGNGWLYFKGRIICSDCGYVLKAGKNMRLSYKTGSEVRA